MLTEENTEREIKKPLWFEMNKKEFDELTGRIYNNQDNNNLKVIINKKAYNIKNSKKNWMEVTLRKIPKTEGEKLY